MIGMVLTEKQWESDGFEVWGNMSSNDLIRENGFSSNLVYFPRLKYIPDKIIVELLVEKKARDRAVRIHDDFSFFDSRGKEWKVKRGRIVDGKSIPPFLWGWILGTPFVGDMRRGSVVHDVACEDKYNGLYTDISWRDIHRYTFYDGGMADGANRHIARLYYNAIRVGGPK
jgi:hypothetical protein